MDHSVPLYLKYAWLDHRYDTLCHINIEYFISNCVVLRSKYSYRLLQAIIILKSHNVLKFCDSNDVINLTYLGLSPIVKKKEIKNSDWLQRLHFKVKMWLWIFRPVRLVANINQCVIGKEYYHCIANIREFIVHPFSSAVLYEKKYYILMVIQNHALPDSDQNGNSCYRSLIHRYFIVSQNAVFSILCSYFF